LTGRSEIREATSAQFTMSGACCSFRNDKEVMSSGTFKEPIQKQG
jgi:hypothetical protein